MVAIVPETKNVLPTKDMTVSGNFSIRFWKQYVYVSLFTSIAAIVVPIVDFIQKKSFRCKNIHGPLNLPWVKSYPDNARI